MVRHLRTSPAAKLPASVKEAAARLAKEDGVSLYQWIAVDDASYSDDGQAMTDGNSRRHLRAGRLITGL